MTPFHAYCENVINGRAGAGELERLSVERFYADLDRGDYIFDYDRGERVVKFFESVLRHWKGKWAGSPLILEPHQHFYLIQQFGWLRQDGTRRFRSTYKEVARKNGKTSECAGKALFLISKDGESGAQVYCAATKEEQARILTNDAGQIVKVSPHIRDRFKIYEYQGTAKRILYLDDPSFITALGRDSKSQDGLHPSAAIIDEYHEHKTDDMLNVLSSGMGGRSQPMLDVITTAGFNKHGPCYRLRKTAIDILRGVKSDDSLLTMIFTLDKDDDWQDEDVWRKSNPNLNISVDIDYLRDEKVKALNEGATKEVNFKTKHLNVWTDASDVWIQSHLWDKCGDKPIVDSGKKWFLGADLSSTRDYTAVAFTSVGDNGWIDILCWGFIPEETVRERLKDESVNLLDWIRRGDVILTKGNATDMDEIEKFIKDKWADLGGTFGAFDHWQANQMIQHLESAGLNIGTVPQTMAMLSEPAKMLEKAVLTGKLRHGGNQALAWMISNCIAETDSKNNIWINKEFKENKIDMVKAILFSLRAYLSYEDETPNLFIGGVNF